MVTLIPALMLILVLALLFYFVYSTTANGNCDADISRNTSIYTSIDASSTNAIQLTKYNYNHKYNTKTFSNMSTNTSMKDSCQYNTKTDTSTSTNTSTKNSIRICMGTNKYIDKFSKSLLTLMPRLRLRLTSILMTFALLRTFVLTQI